VRLFATLLSLSLVGTAFGDAKTDFIKALDEAKLAGLPISPADMKVPMPTAQAQRIERLIDKADKEMRRHQLSLGDTVDLDFKNIERKNKGLPRIEYPKPTPAQEADRSKAVLAVIEEIGKTTGPRVPNSVTVLADSFPRGALIKGLVNAELDAAQRIASKGDAREVVRRLKLTRRLIELIRSDSTMVGVLMEQASEQKYYATLQRVSKDHAAIGRTFTRDLVSPFQKPSVAQILREEFLKTLAGFDITILPKNSKSSIKVGNWSLLGDTDSLKLITNYTKSWTIAYKELKDCKSGLELETRYKSIVPKLGVLKSEGQDDFVLGPSWAENARALDRAEAKRLETIKALGIR
jgi:hypothetical protein